MKKELFVFFHDLFYYSKWFGHQNSRPPNSVYFCRFWTQSTSSKSFEEALGQMQLVSRFLKKKPKTKQIFRKFARNLENDWFFEKNLISCVRWNIVLFLLNVTKQMLIHQWAILYGIWAIQVSNFRELRVKRKEIWGKKLMH